MKTTKQHFAIFKKECEKWIDFWGLHDWEVCFFHDTPKGGDDNSRAATCADYKGRIASLFLIPDWKDDNVTDKDLKRCAFHEVCELLFWKISSAAWGDVYMSSKQVIEETHRLIRILENKVWRGK